MKLVKMRQDTAEPELVSLVEQRGSSKTSRLLNLAGMLSSWRGRTWPLLLVVLLVILFVPYFRIALTMLRRVHAPFDGVPLSSLPVIGVLFLVLFSLLRPTWALALFFAVAPLANGLVAWVTLGDPALHQKAGMFWVEPLFLSLGIGFILRRIFWPEPMNSKGIEISVAFYAVVALTSTALYFLESPWLWDRLTLAWLHIPRMRQLSPNHPFRAGLLILASLLCYRLTLNRLRTSREIHIVCRAWLVGALFATGYDVWRLMGFQGPEYPEYPRVQSVLADWNSYASYLVLTLFIAWGEWLTEKERWARVMAGLTLLFTVWMIPLAGSRIAIIAAAAGTGVACAFLAKSRRGCWIRWGFLVAVASGILLFPFVGGRGVLEGVSRNHPGLFKYQGLAKIARMTGGWSTVNNKDKYETAVNGLTPEVSGSLEDYRWGGRLAMLAVGIRMVRENPAFGLGPGTAYRELGPYYYRPWDVGMRYTRENLHNYFIQVAAETGLLGLAGFLWVVLVVVAHGFSRDLGKERRLARLLSIGVGSYLITALTSHPLVLSEQAFLFWGGLGILGACSRQGQAPSVAPSSPR
jgi:hypothetical protein